MPLQEVQGNNARALNDIADTIARSHKVLVVTGAGISTSCGIPDFRSKDGLYNMVPEQYLPTPPSSQPSTPSRKRKLVHIEQAETPSRKRQAVDNEEDEDAEPPSSQSSTTSRNHRRQSSSPASRMSGQDLFHARVFHRADTTQIFNQFIAGFKQELRDEVESTSKTHKFIRALRDGGRLMRCYTQNIDGLEEREGLCVDLSRGKGNKRRFMKKHYELPRPEEIRDTDFDGGCEVVQLHGELSKLRCTVCSVEEEWSEQASEILLEGAAPTCNSCTEKSEVRQATGKRGLTVGTLRPNIVLYGEEHPHNMLLSPLVPYDIASGPEVLIIMGTSLKVLGMQKIIRDFAKAIHSKKNGRVIFVNRTRPAESIWDGVIDDFVQLDCDDWVEDLKTRRPGLWLRQGELDLKEMKSKTPAKKRKSDSIETKDSSAPTKKAKIKRDVLVSVDIPPRKISPKRRIITKEPATPSSNKASQRTTKWRNGTPSQELRALLSPLARANRPPVSPLSNSTGLTETMDSETHLRRSPLPPTFSPITPKTPSRFQAKTPSRLRIHEDITDNDAGTSSDQYPERDTVPDVEINDTILSPKRNLSSKLIAVQTEGMLNLAKGTSRVVNNGGSPVKRTLIGRLLERFNA